MSKRSIRDKLLCYLTIEYGRKKDEHFTIPFNRQQLADYLCVERSALSAEMSRMKKEKIIDYKKNEFWLL
ncbi:MAG: winged helix-turn-helix domain-containing protein, partial [Firmicutes bacterium]|nr:winged helix-turn-helix domain-containing protein [Bacillota bacterium]